MSTSAELEKIVKTLEQSGKFRVLRQIEPRSQFHENDKKLPERRGIILDVETTGLDNAIDEVIEIALLPFTYGLDGKLYAVQEAYHSLQDTSRDILPEITAITSITKEMVEGKAIDIETLESLVSKADLIVAHNASFDRPFAEKLSQEFKVKPWACSMSQINWRQEGFEGNKLPYLVSQAGYFYHGHRAVNDCIATLELLAMNLPNSGTSAFATLLKTARENTTRIWAVGAPYELKDDLKARGYRWNGEVSSDKPKAWYVDVPEVDTQRELEFLYDKIFGQQLRLPSNKITAVDRFSNRV